MAERLTFKTDTAELTKWLGSRKKSLEKARQAMESTWEDIRMHFEPCLGKALLNGSDVNDDVSKRDDDKILNSTSRTILARMAAGLQSGITNQSRQWFKLQSIDAKVRELSQVRAWLDATTEKLSSILNRSNAYPSLDLTYKYLGQFGTSAGVIYSDAETDCHIYVADCGSYWIAENRRGRVNVMLYKRQMTLNQILEEFGESATPDLLLKQIEKGDGEKLEYVYCHIEPYHKRFKDVDPSRKFVSVYYMEGQGTDQNHGILAIRSFGYNPIIAPRWSVFGSVYGIGCGHQGLGDAKMLQTMEEDKLRVVQQAVDPSMLAPASMRGEPIDTGPGGITFFNEVAGGGKPTVGRLFETQENLQAIMLAIQDVEARLNRTFYADLFAMMINLQTHPKQMTVREVNELSGEKVSLLGPILTRMNADLLDPLIDAVFSIAIENGMLDEPPEVLQGQPLRVEYVSSLHVEQTATTVLSGLYKIADFAAGIAKFDPGVIDKLDTDQMIDKAATVLTEYGVVRDDEAVKKIRDASAEQQRQMMEMEMKAKYAPAMAKAAKDLSQTPVGDGNALEASMGAGQ